MEALASMGVLALLHRDGARTRIFCHADHIKDTLAAAMSETATRYSRATVRHDRPVSPRQDLRFRRVHPRDLPAGTPTVASFGKDHQIISWMASDHISEELAIQLQEICAEETRYLSPLPLIAPPAVPDAGKPGRR